MGLTQHTAAIIPAPGSGPLVWAIDGMERVRLDDISRGTTFIELWAARGEYEPFQIAIRAPAGGLDEVDLSVGPLWSDNGTGIPVENVTLYRQHFIGVAQGSPAWRRNHPLPPDGRPNEPLGPGIYPEPLIPFRDPIGGAVLPAAPLIAAPFSVPAGHTQPIWVDIFVPPDTLSGTYHATFTVTSVQGTADIGLTLHVWDFELPLKPSLRSDFGFWNALDKASAVTLVRHRLMPRDIEPAWLERLAKFGLNGVNIGFWSHLNQRACAAGENAMLPPPTVDEVKAIARVFERGLAHHSYFADEIDDCSTYEASAEQVRDFARALQEGGTTPLLTAYPSDAFWIDGPFIWALPPYAFLQSDGLERVREHGQELWSYNAVYLDNYSPKWLLDYPALNFRLQPGFISQSLGLTGLLYWAVDYWVEGEEWAEPIAFGPNYPGEGVLVYPGSMVGVEGVVPGLRLKWLREGVEDYEYVELLKQQGEGAFALELTRSVGRSFVDWSRNPAAVQAVRRRLGDRLHELASR